MRCEILKYAFNSHFTYMHKLWCSSHMSSASVCRMCKFVSSAERIVVTKLINRERSKLKRKKNTHMLGCYIYSWIHSERHNYIWWENLLYFDALWTQLDYTKRCLRVSAGIHYCPSLDILSYLKFMKPVSPLDYYRPGRDIRHSHEETFWVHIGSSVVNVTFHLLDEGSCEQVKLSVSFFNSNSNSFYNWQIHQNNRLT